MQKNMKKKKKKKKGRKIHLLDTVLSLRYSLYVVHNCPLKIENPLIIFDYLFKKQKKQKFACLANIHG